MPSIESLGNRVSAVGLTTSEARTRLLRYGPNRVEQEHRHPVRALLAKFWAPVPWMLEATVALELLARKPKEAVIIGALLLFNAVLSFAQESQADQSLALLRKRLAVRARVLRDARWQILPADQLVPDDVIRLRLGDLAPADARLLDGNIEADESSLTGESLPVEKSTGAVAYAGSRLTHGEATAQVVATGSRTYFGRTAELVKTARTASHLQEIVFTIVKYLVGLDAVLASLLLLFARWAHLPWSEVLPFVLILLVASVPVALPATFTVATALGALEMSRNSVLVTRLSAIEEAAAMDVLCSDKTGTITQNNLSVSHVVPVGNHTPAEVVRMAALASDAATQDPIDLAVLSAAQQQAIPVKPPERVQFIPFDPATKRSEGIYETPGGKLRVVKGAPASVAQLAAPQNAIAAEIEEIAARGARVIAVAAGSGGPLDLYGFLGLADPLRPDSVALVRDLQNLGVRVVMVTGDTPETARAIATQVGIGSRIGSVSDLQSTEAASRFDAFAGVFPADKFHLVQALQREGHIVGMTGDGVNDAPALKQAEVGIAVANATDVAKAAASIVLVESGLSGILRAVETGRRIYQRMLTYTLNKIVKTLEIAVFLSIGVMLTRVFVVTPLLVVLLLFTNDFVTMSIATDRVSFSSRPDRWDVRKLMLTAAPLAALMLLLSFSVFFFGRDVLRLPLPRLQTLVFLTLVFTGQGNVYLVRERLRLWHSRPSRWLIIASVADVIAVSLMANFGILMARIPWRITACLCAIVVVYLVLIDAFKVRIFRRFAVA